MEKRIFRGRKHRLQQRGGRIDSGISLLDYGGGDKSLRKDPLNSQGGTWGRKTELIEKIGPGEFNHLENGADRVDKIGGW